MAPIQQREVKIIYLSLTESQCHSVDEIYKSSRQTTLSFILDDTQDQEIALTKLAELGLDQVSRTALESRWTVQWSTTWETNKARKNGRCFNGKLSFQINQGRQRDKRKKGLQVDTKRRNPYQFTGCLAHVEIVERIQDGAVTSICGVFVHNKGCDKSVIQRTPEIPLHEHVYEEALKQLQNGASITAIQEKNCAMINEKLYRDMDTYNPASANVRYLFLQSDHATLYQKASKELGVDARLQPKAVFHYSARAEAEDRFEVCISTPEMDEGANKYAHHSQVILDGTFGVCSSRLLLFIALAADKDKKGVPIAFFLFSAATGQ
ncbi:hypothetical protein BDP27DRAFT_1455783 [Rhodocollybia butyracea]|uniref:Uncharacterized protein n=1 Tax=Rhodocollybia butyracea TaxID=206335 RepID=A0A9P5P5Z0_9AGAR|nr:hypothetical protein BDP27DRAFT_1455783 [Rhodocollybia butyracea]